MTRVDAAIVGAGIVGAACADQLTQAGLSVAVFDPSPAGGTTAAGMGHVLVVDEDPALHVLTQRGRALWERVHAELPAAAQWDPAGTLWVATDDQELEQAHAMARARMSRAEVLTARDVHRAEPNLAEDVVGALFVPGDRTLYPPAAAHWLLMRAQARGATVFREAVAHIDGTRLRTRNGSRLDAEAVVLATGSAVELLPRHLGCALRPRKGHLAITRRYPGFLRHHVAELGYFASTDPSKTESIAFNVQPRVTGQILIGATRQLGNLDPAVDRGLVARMFARALRFMPDLQTLDVLRVWTGVRPATADKRPLIGPVPDHRGLHVAIGHEGLGITTALATAELVRAGVLGSQAPIDPSPYLPARLEVSPVGTQWRTSA